MSVLQVREVQQGRRLKLAVYKFFIFPAHRGEQDDCPFRVLQAET